MQVWGSLGEPISCLKKLNVCLTIFQFAPEVTLGISDLILVHTLPLGNVGGTFAHKSIGLRTLFAVYTKLRFAFIGIYVLKIPLICCDELVLRLDSHRQLFDMYTQQIPFHRSVVKFMM